jgi:hypothetical protein
MLEPKNASATIGSTLTALSNWFIAFPHAQIHRKIGETALMPVFPY